MKLSTTKGRLNWTASEHDVYLPVHKYATKSEVEECIRKNYNYEGMYILNPDCERRWNKFTGYSPSFEETFPLRKSNVIKELTAQYEYTGPNIDLQTDENKKPDVPDNFVKVKFSKGKHKKLFVSKLIDETGDVRLFDELVYYVNPDINVDFEDEDSDKDFYGDSAVNYHDIRPQLMYRYSQDKNDKDWLFDKWDINIRNQRFRDGDVVTALYKYVGKDVVGQKTGKPKPDVPDNFKLVEFSGDEDAHILITPKEISKFWVNPEKDVTLTGPKTKSYPGYEFGGWDQSLTQKFTDATLIKAKAKEVMTGLVNPDDPLNPDKENFWTVTFKSADESKGTIGIANTVYVPKSLNKTLADIVPPTPSPVNGFRFKKWSLNLDKNTKIDKNIKVEAIFGAKVFDPDHVEKMVVKEQPTKLNYTEGEKLDLAGLEVTLTDNQGLTKDVAFDDFGTNGITANPTDGTELKLVDNGKPVALTKGSLQDETTNLTVKAKVFDPEHVEKMEVKEQPTKLVYTEGEKLDLTGLVVTLKDNQGLTKDVAFKDFASYAITAAPENDTALTLANNGKKVTLTKGNLTAETQALTVKEIVKTGTDPNTPVPNGYTRITFDATKDGNINGHRYKVIDVLNGTGWDNADVKKEIPARATYKDTTKIFTEWDSTVPTAGPVEAQEFTATYREPAPTPNPTNPIVGPVDPSVNPNPDESKNWTVTFVADSAKGTIASENTFYVLKDSGKTLADLVAKAPKVTAKTEFKFTGWNPALDANTEITGNLTVNATFEKVTVTPAPTPNPTDPKVDKYHHDYWYGPYWTYSYGSSNTTNVNASQVKKIVKLEARLVIGSKTMVKSVDGVEERIMMDIAPFIEKDRTMLPIRFVAEALEFNVQWDKDSRTVILIDKENVVKIPVDTNKIIVNGKEYISDVKPVIRNNRTMLPIANIARALGLKDGKDIFWNGNTKEVLITREVSK